MVKKAVSLAAAAIGLLFMGAPNVWAVENDALAACLAEVPGAVTAQAVSEGDDTVCLGPEDDRVPSAGDDTYLWVGEEAEGSVAPSMGPTGYLMYADPGVDTLSLSRWSSGWTESYEVNGFGGMFGVRVFFDVEKITLTPQDDSFGDLNACGRLTENNGLVINAGAGDDTLNCVAGELIGGGGADVITGVALGTTVAAGAGSDLVIGDGDADSIRLGRGGDCAVVTRGGVDTVYGGIGRDGIVAGGNDVLVSAQDVTACIDPLG